MSKGRCKIQRQQYSTRNSVESIATVWWQQQREQESTRSENWLERQNDLSQIATWSCQMTAEKFTSKGTTLLAASLIDARQSTRAPFHESRRHAWNATQTCRCFRAAFRVAGVLTQGNSHCRRWYSGLGRPPQESPVSIVHRPVKSIIGRPWLSVPHRFRKWRDVNPPSDLLRTGDELYTRG